MGRFIGDGSEQERGEGRMDGWMDGWEERGRKGIFRSLKF